MTPATIRWTAIATATGSETYRWAGTANRGRPPPWGTGPQFGDRLRRSYARSCPCNAHATCSTIGPMARSLVLCAGLLALAACDVGRVGPPGDDTGDDTGGVDAAAALACRNAGVPGLGHDTPTHPQGNKG